MTQDLHLGSSGLDVVVHPSSGGSIGSIKTKRGAELMMRTSWNVSGNGPVAWSEGQGPWLERFRGGWHTLIPNAGDGCIDGTEAHGFHGEASTAEWTAEKLTPECIELEVRLVHSPLRIKRRIAVSEDVVSVEETVTNEGPSAYQFMWVHHPVLGGDLLSGPVEILLAGQAVRLDPDGAQTSWPHASTEQGDLDLANPANGDAWLAYVGVTDGRAEIRQRTGDLAVELTWDREVFPGVWVWCELEGTSSWPWFQRYRALAVEPASTSPSRGLVHARDNSRHLVELQAGQSRTTTVRLRVLEGPATVTAAEVGI